MAHRSKTLSALGPPQSQDDQAVTYPLSMCMTCGCCVEACPNFHDEKTGTEARMFPSFRLLRSLTRPQGQASVPIRPSPSDPSPFDPRPLEALGMPTEPPAIAPARAPPQQALRL